MVSRKVSQNAHGVPFCGWATAAESTPALQEQESAATAGTDLPKLDHFVLGKHKESLYMSLKKIKKIKKICQILESLSLM